MRFFSLITGLICFISISNASHAATLLPNVLTNAFKDGHPSLDFRLRYENALQTNLQDAQATTLRSAVGYETAEFYCSTISLQMVDVASFFGQRYNPGVSDLSKPNYSLIADPRGAGLTEGKYVFKGIEKNVFVLGRQFINLDNQRFIGQNDFRQFPQSFDALSLTNTMFESVKFYYAYITFVNTNNANGRSVNGRRNLNTQLFNLDWNGYRYGNIVAYLYLNKDNTILTNSNSTIGFRISATQDQTDNFAYTLEFASQSSRFNNPIDYTAHYIHCEFGQTIEWFTGILGVEDFSGSSYGSNQNFITPLGSVNNFNGLAEAFPPFPNRGLQDYYATFRGTYKSFSLAVTAHFFLLDKGPGSRRAGQELDISADVKLNDQIALNIAYAKYVPMNSVAVKTRRFWAMITANLL